MWPNYKNSPIFIQGQNKKFKFVLQGDLMISVDNKLCSMLVPWLVCWRWRSVHCHKSYQTSAHLVCVTFYGEVRLLVVGSRVLWFWTWHSGSNFSAQLSTVQSWYWRKANGLDSELRHHCLLISTFMFYINILFKLFCMIGVETKKFHCM